MPSVELTVGVSSTVAACASTEIMSGAVVPIFSVPGPCRESIVGIARYPSSETVTVTKSSSAGSGSALALERNCVGR